MLLKILLGPIQIVIKTSISKLVTLTISNSIIFIICVMPNANSAPHGSPVVVTAEFGR